MHGFAVALLLIPALAHADPLRRIGVDGSASIGPVVSIGVELRAEIPFAARHALTLRAEWQRAEYVFGEEEEGGPAPARRVAGAYIGDRRYNGDFYLDVALGVAHIYGDDYTDTLGDRVRVHDFTLPAARLGFGGKVNGRLDVGLELMFPVVGVGLHMGVDLGAW